LRDNVTDNKTGKVVLQDINGDITTDRTGEVSDGEEEFGSPRTGSNNMQGV
jgi:hypothetical protein